MENLFPHGVILMADPSAFCVKYKINPWMKPNAENKQKAIQQWKNLRNTIVRLGAFVEVVKPTRDDIPDFVFTANACLIHNNRAVLSKFRFPERQKEEKEWERIFEKTLVDTKGDPKFGIVYHSLSNFYFEGAGDWLPHPIHKNTFIAGCGFRSLKESNVIIEKELRTNAIHMSLVNPYFYHLDTCLCPLPQSETILAYPGAFMRKEFENLTSDMKEIVEVPEDEAKRFACNSVVLGNQIIMPQGCPKTTEKLEKRGYKVYPVELDEFIKSGGAAKCLTLKLE